MKFFYKWINKWENNYIEKKLKECNYKALLQCVASPNLPAWRLRKWLKEQWEKENDKNL